MTAPGGNENCIAKERMQGFPLTAFYKANPIAHLVHGDGCPLTIEIEKLLHHLGRHLYLRAFPQNFHLGSPADKLTVKFTAKHL